MSSFHIARNASNERFTAFPFASTLFIFYAKHATIVAASIEKNVSFTLIFDIFCYRLLASSKGVRHEQEASGVLGRRFEAAKRGAVEGNEDNECCGGGGDDNNDDDDEDDEDNEEDGVELRHALTIFNDL